MSEWISVQLRLPSADTPVLAWWDFDPKDTTDAPFDVVRYHSAVWWSADDMDQDYKAPNFWMPLSEPPK